MGVGMLGALKGFGEGTAEFGNVLQKEVQAETELGRKKDFQSWLLSNQEQFQIRTEARGEERAIRTEQRTDKRAEEQKDRDLERTIRETEPRATAKARGNSIEHDGKSGDAARTADVDAGVKAKQTEAGESQSTKDLRKAQADFYGTKGDALEGKADPMDSAELKALQARSGKLEDTINKAKAEGSWTGTPEQKELERQLKVMNQQQRDILKRARGDAPAGPTGADPLQRRAPAAGASPTGAPAAPKKPGGMLSQPGDTDRAAIYSSELEKARARVASETDPDRKRRAETDVAGIEREMKAAGIAVPGAAAAAPAARAPAAATAAPAARAPMATAGGAPAAAPSMPRLEAVLKPGGAEQQGGAATPGANPISRAARYLAGLGENFDTPAGKVALRLRMQEAAAGGEPLSDVERLRAEQLGLTRAAASVATPQP